MRHQLLGKVLLGERHNGEITLLKGGSTGGVADKYQLFPGGNPKVIPFTRRDHGFAGLYSEGLSIGCVLLDHF